MNERQADDEHESRGEGMGLTTNTRAGGKGTGTYGNSPFIPMLLTMLRYPYAVPHMDIGEYSGE